MSEYLRRQIAARRTRLASLDLERTTIIAELAAYEDALANAPEDTIQLSITNRSKMQDRTLPVSKAWRAILERLAEFKHFNASDVKGVAQQLYANGRLRKPQTNEGVRAQLSLYTKRGLISRRGNGSYFLTDKSKAALLATIRTPQDTLDTKQLGPELRTLAQVTADDAR